MDKSEIYKIKPADNVKLAEMELTVERAWKRMTNEKQAIMLRDIQSLIERIKLDDKKIRKLEKMNGISWLGDEARGEGIPGGEGLEGKQDLRLLPKIRTAANLYEDRSRWAIPINCADGGFKQQAYWQGREDGAREMEKEFHGE